MVRKGHHRVENILDTSKVALADLGSNGVKYPALWINLTLALELGWFVEDKDEADPQFAYKRGPNLCVQLHTTKFLLLQI